jgi:hypothetical protein
MATRPERRPRRLTWLSPVLLAVALSPALMQSSSSGCAQLCLLKPSWRVGVRRWVAANPTGNNGLSPRMH